MITLILLFFCLALLASIVIGSISNGIAPMPTSAKAKKVWLQALPPLISGVVYELGAGWGTLLLPLGHRYPHEEIVGFETSPVPYWVARLRIALMGLQNVCVKRQNFYQANLKDAGLVLCYLYPGAMVELKLKFEKELKPGTWVISNTFAIPGWQPVQVIEVHDLYRTKIYIYTYRA